MTNYTSIYKNNLKEIFGRESSAKGKISGNTSSGWIVSWQVRHEDMDIGVKLSMSPPSVTINPQDPSDKFFKCNITFQTKRPGGQWTYSNQGDNAAFKVFPGVFANVNRVKKMYMDDMTVFFTFAGVNPAPKYLKKQKRLAHLFSDFGWNFYIKKEDLDRVIHQSPTVREIIRTNFLQGSIENPKEDYKEMLWVLSNNPKISDLSDEKIAYYKRASSNFYDLIVNHTIEEFILEDANSEDKQIGFYSKNLENVRSLKNLCVQQHIDVVEDNLPSEEELARGNQRNNIYIYAAIKFGAENVYSSGQSIIVGDNPLPSWSNLRTNYKVERETNIDFIGTESFYNADIQEKLVNTGGDLKKLLNLNRSYLKNILKLNVKDMVKLDSFIFSVCLLSKYDPDITFDKLKNKAQSGSFDIMGDDWMIKLYRNRKNLLYIFPSNNKSPLFKKITTDILELKRDKQISNFYYFDNLQGFLNA